MKGYHVRKHKRQSTKSGKTFVAGKLNDSMRMLKVVTSSHP